MTEFDEFLRGLTHAQLVVLQARLGSMLGPWMEELRPGHGGPCWERRDLRLDRHGIVYARRDGHPGIITRPCSADGGVQPDLPAAMAHADAALVTEGRLLVETPWPLSPEWR